MSPPRRRETPARPQQLCEAEVVAGLKDQAASELRTRFGSDARLLRKARPDELPFHFRGDLAALGTVGKSNAINLVQHFDIPRPAAFLGHEHQTRLLRQIDSVRSLHESGSFHSFRISAAGRDSPVMQRLREAIANRTNLVYDEREGDLLLRIRKADLHQTGWELLTRMTPRPLSARSWRVRNLPGAPERHHRRRHDRIDTPTTRRSLLQPDVRQRHPARRAPVARAPAGCGGLRYGPSRFALRDGQPARRRRG